MPTLKEILDDPKTFTDDIKLSISGQEVTLGDLRGLSKSTQDTLSARLADADKKFREVTELAVKAAEVKAELDRQLAAKGAEDKGNKGGAGGGDDEFDTHPAWNPVRTRLSKINETMKSLEDTTKKLSAAAERMGLIWYEDRSRGQFDRNATRLGKSQKHKDMTYEKVRDYAAEHKILDSFGLPSVERAIVELTRDDDIEARLAQAKEEGRKEGEMRGRLAAQGRPTSAAGAKKPDGKSHVADKGLEGLGDDVAEDKDLMQMLADLGAANPADFGNVQ